jgi:molybdopterin adenylyltransferase
MVPDRLREIADTLIAWVDEERLPLIITSGGTGLSPNDLTPQAMETVIDFQVPGMAEAMRAESLKKTPHAMISRAMVGVRKTSLIINLPGSPRGAGENLAVVLPALNHSLAKLGGDTSDCAPQICPGTHHDPSRFIPILSVRFSNDVCHIRNTGRKSCCHRGPGQAGGQCFGRLPETDQWAGGPGKNPPGHRLEKAEFMDSSGLGALVSRIAATRANHGDVCLAAPSPQILNLLQITHLDKVFKCFDHVDSAVKQLRIIMFRYRTWPTDKPISPEKPRKHNHSEFHFMEPDYDRETFQIPAHFKKRLLNRLAFLYGAHTAARPATVNWRES